MQWQATLLVSQYESQLTCCFLVTVDVNWLWFQLLFHTFVTLCAGGVSLSGCCAKQKCVTVFFKLSFHRLSAFSVTALTTQGCCHRADPAFFPPPPPSLLSHSLRSGVTALVCHARCKHTEARTQNSEYANKKHANNAFVLTQVHKHTCQHTPSRWRHTAHHGWVIPKVNSQSLGTEFIFASVRKVQKMKENASFKLWWMIATLKLTFDLFKWQT